MRRMMRTGNRPYTGQGGFTLFEVVMVLLILGIISYFAATRLFSEQDIPQVAEMDLVKNHLRYAQLRAMNTDKNWGLVFELPSKYWLYYENQAGNRVSVRLPGDDTSTDNKMTLKSLTISSITNTLYPNEVRFFCGSPDTNQRGQFGSPSASNTSSEIIIGTSAGSIRIKPNTGYIP